MIHEYQKDNIVHHIWDLIKWENDSRFNSLLFVEKNNLIYNYNNLSVDDFKHYQDYVLGLMLLFYAYNEYKEELQLVGKIEEEPVVATVIDSEKEDEDETFWKEIERTLGDIFSSEQQLFLRKFLSLCLLKKKQMSFLHSLYVEVIKYLLLNEESFWCNLNFHFKDINEFKAPIHSLNDISIPFVFYSLLERFKIRTMPFPNSFIEDIEKTNNEMVFHMFLSMIQYYKDRKKDESSRYSYWFWRYETPFNSLLEMLSNYTEMIDVGVKKYSNEILNKKTLYDGKILEEIAFSLEEAVEETDTTFETAFDTNGVNKKDFYRIAPGKIEVQNPSSYQLYKRLEALYESLNSQNCFNKPCKDAFIYRLSGFQRPENLEIEWVGANAFLGKIIRCLYEDKETGQKPPYKKIAEFMGLHNKNLADAINAKKGKADTDRVIKLLKDCGFANVDVFEASE